MNRTRCFVMAVGLLALAVAASVTSAQAATATTVQASANVTWTPPTTDSNGVALSAAEAITSYAVYANTSPLTAVPTTAPLATVTAPSTSVSGSAPAPVGATLYVYVVACNAIGCGGLSVAGTKVVSQVNAPPGVPTNVTITLTIAPVTP
jgi:hypothetical protein